MTELLSIIPGPLPVKLALLALPMLPNIWGIWCAYKHRLDGQGQMIWMVACVFVPVIAGVAYFLFGRPKAVGAKSKNDN